jgi:hypothetical protein
MSKWILICPKCKTEFEHSQISDVGMSFLMIPAKPEFATAGNECVALTAAMVRSTFLFCV